MQYYSLIINWFVYYLGCEHTWVLQRYFTYCLLSPAEGEGWKEEVNLDQHQEYQQDQQQYQQQDQQLGHQDQHHRNQQDHQDLLLFVNISGYNN